MNPFQTTLRQVVVAALVQIVIDNGVVLKGPKATYKLLSQFYVKETDYTMIADEIVQAWGESPDEIVTNDFYEDIVLGIHEYGGWLKRRKGHKQ